MKNEKNKEFIKKVKLSNKGQITVPVLFQRMLNIHNGEALYLVADGKDNIVIRKSGDKLTQKTRGLGKDLWQKLGGGEKYLREERKSW